jgi:hypothetical protein
MPKLGGTIPDFSHHSMMENDLNLLAFAGKSF